MSQSTPPFPHLTRRSFQLAALGTGLQLLGCTHYHDPSANPVTPKAAPMTPEQQKIMAARARMMAKFKGLGGVGMNFNAKAGEEFLGVTFYREDDTNRVFYQSSALWRKDRIRGNGYTSSAGIASIPERARVVWREDAQRQNDRYIGKIIGQHVIDVGLAVPDAVIEDIRKNGGGLEFKFMLAPETCYFGWIVWRPSPTGYSERTINGKQVRVPRPYPSVMGGNFVEAYLDYENGAKGKLVKGWHIDPRTGQKVETDY